jgi:transposase-like protein
METKDGRRITKKYSSAFKHKVVSEIEAGKFTMHSARKFYDIHGGDTIQSWIRKHGKTHLLTEVVMTTVKSEKNREKALQERVALLEKALADAHLKIFVLESTVSVLEQNTPGEKKSVVTKSSKTA